MAHRGSTLKALEPPRENANDLAATDKRVNVKEKGSNAAVVGLQTSNSVPLASTKVADPPKVNASAHTDRGEGANARAQRK